jgi:hypothetical protein
MPESFSEVGNWCHLYGATISIFLLVLSILSSARYSHIYKLLCGGKEIGYWDSIQRRQGAGWGWGLKHSFSEWKGVLFDLYREIRRTAQG